MATTGGISDEAVKAKTGRTWTQWCVLLDRAGAADTDHKGIVAIIKKRYPDLGGWWTQMVTVGYEQARGLREKHQMPTGFEIGASRTIGVPIADVFAAWKQTRRRRRWLELPERRECDDLVIRKATDDRTLRITWVDDRTHIDVYLTDKGAGRTQVAVRHKKLRTARAAEKQKTYWRKQLGNLKGWLEG